MIDGVRVEARGQVLLITIDRPKANAIAAHTSRDLHSAFEELQRREDLRVGILTGAGTRFFSAGWDLKAAAEGEAHDADHGSGGFGGLSEYFTLSKPVIAAVNGSAYGGGVELMLAAHFAVASSEARFAFPEARLGILPDAGGLTRLPAALPQAVALELLITGREFSADEALSWGLVNAVAPPERVLDRAFELAGSICRAASLAVSSILAAVQATRGMPAADAALRVREELPSVASIIHTDDAQEGARAFAEGREPVWRGR